MTIQEWFKLVKNILKIGRKKQNEIGETSRDSTDNSLNNNNKKKTV
jgi:hypothetical protein